jgi:hypothetical protein
MGPVHFCCYLGRGDSNKTEICVCVCFSLHKKRMRKENKKTHNEWEGKMKNKKKGGDTVT